MIDAVILAAGRGARMGSLKPLVSINGRPALERILQAVREAGVASPLVVLGHGADAVREGVDLTGCRCVINPNPDRGLASSLRVGLEALGPSSQGTLILLADMPAVRSETIRAVIGLTLAGATLGAPVFDTRRGFPVYVGRSQFEALLPELHGDRGAHAFLATHQSELATVEVDDPGCVLDFDRPEDLAQFERGLPCNTSA